MINIVNIDKAELLATLYNNSQSLGISGLFGKNSSTMTKEEAQRHLDISAPEYYFDYLEGRVMKINLSSDTEFNPILYDRDNGTGSAQRVVDILRNREK